MQCPNCGSTEIRKNGKRGSKQNHICTRCRHQFIDGYDPLQGHSEETKQHCLKLYINGTGFRAIERSTGVYHTTVIYWVKQTGEQLPAAPLQAALGDRCDLEKLLLGHRWESSVSRLYPGRRPNCE